MVPCMVRRVCNSTLYSEGVCDSTLYGEGVCDSTLYGEEGV